MAQYAYGIVRKGDRYATRKHSLEWNSFTLTEPDPIDKMSPLYSQLTWLDRAGFAGIDVYWLLAGHAIFGGTKNE